MRFKYVATAAALLISTQLIAGETYIGLGAKACGSWTSRRASVQQQVAFESWLFGYLSGLNVLSSGDVLKGRDVGGLTGWMDNYCRSNPLELVIIGANGLALELKNKPN
jgi:hypothetical protein